MNKIALGLQALGAGFQGGDPYELIRRANADVEREERKEAIGGLLDRMNISGPDRALIETLPVEQATSYLLQMRQQRAAQARAGAAAARKEAARRAEIEAMQGYFAPRTEQVAPMGPTVAAAEAGAASGGDLAALQTRTAIPKLTPELMQQVLMDPRISDAGRKRIMDVYELQQEAIPEPNYQLVNGQYVDMNNPMAGAQDVPGLVEEEAAPYSAIGKLQADLFNGKITQAQYDLALQNMRPKGMRLQTTADGGLLLEEGAGVGDAPTNLNELQSKNAIFATRATGALNVLDREINGEPLANLMTSRLNRAAEFVPMGFGREMQSGEYQVAAAAGQEFLQAVLRKDTGAAITEQEQILYGRLYLPQPGDTPEVLQYRAQARRRAANAIEAGMTADAIRAKELAIAKENGVDIFGEAADETPQTVSFADMTASDLMGIDITEENAAAWNKRWEELNQ